MNISRQDKIKAIGLKGKYTKIHLPNNILNNIYQMEINIQKNQVKSYIYTKKPKNPKVNNNDIKYTTVLKFLNKLLEQLNMENIINITEFKNIKRNDILSNQCKIIINNNIDELCKAFGKVKLDYYNRNIRKAYMATLLRKLVTLCGYTLESRRKDKKIRNKIISWYEYSVI